VINQSNALLALRTLRHALLDVTFFNPTWRRPLAAAGRLALSRLVAEGFDVGKDSRRVAAALTLATAKRPQSAVQVSVMIWLTVSVKLHRLARLHGLTKRATIERIIAEAERSAVAGMEDTAIEAYYRPW